MHRVRQNSGENKREKWNLHYIRMYARRKLEHHPLEWPVGVAPVHLPWIRMLFHRFSKTSSEDADNTPYQEERQRNIHSIISRSLQFQSFMVHLQIHHNTGCSFHIPESGISSSVNLWSLVEVCEPTNNFHLNQINIFFLAMNRSENMFQRHISNKSYYSLTPCRGQLENNCDHILS